MHRGGRRGGRPADSVPGLLELHVAHVPVAAQVRELSGLVDDVDEESADDRDHAVFEAGPTEEVIAPLDALA